MKKCFRKAQALNALEAAVNDITGFSVFRAYFQA